MSAPTAEETITAVLETRPLRGVAAVVTWALLLCAGGAVLPVLAATNATGSSVYRAGLAGTCVLCGIAGAVAAAIQTRHILISLLTDFAETVVTSLWAVPVFAAAFSLFAAGAALVLAVAVYGVGTLLT